MVKTTMPFDFDYPDVDMHQKLVPVSGAKLNALKVAYSIEPITFAGPLIVTNAMLDINWVE